MILENAGLSFETRPAGVDEAVIKDRGLREKMKPHDIGLALAREKALSVSKRAGDAVVIGADQILECEGRMFDKPKDMAEARQTLLILKGRAHQLISCVAIAEGGVVKSDFYEPATLYMRPFSGAFLDRYLSDAGEAVLTSVGAYQLEGPGAQLFEKIEGDFFTILGLPLLRVLAELRALGALDDA